MNRSVVVSAQAEGQIAAIDAWWRTNRRASPDLFAQELAEAFATLELLPEARQRYPHAELKNARRILLRATRHRVYYVASDEAVVVLALWGSIKGVGPALGSAG